MVDPIAFRVACLKGSNVSFWRSVRREVDGAIRSLSYDLLRRGAEPEHKPSRGVALFGLSVLVLIVATGSYFTVLGLAKAVDCHSTTVPEQVVDSGVQTGLSETVSDSTAANSPQASPTTTKTAALKPSAIRTTTPAPPPKTNPAKPTVSPTPRPASPPPSPPPPSPISPPPPSGGSH